MQTLDKVYHNFIGYDDREKEAYQVARHTLLKHATVPIQVHKLEHKELRRLGLFTRGHKVEGATGQFIDDVDERPFSTQFTFTRFLIPELWRTQLKAQPNVSPLVMFVDCDFLWTQDIGEMFKDIERQKLNSQGRAPLYCVKHDYNPVSEIKMDNVKQHRYNKKLWAAMFVYDMEHEDNQRCTPELVNTAGGRDLMNFCWVSNDHHIGDIDSKWHFIPNHSRDDEIAAIHWTEGGPWFKHLRGGKYDTLWYDAYRDFIKKHIVDISVNITGMIDD